MKRREFLAASAAGLGLGPAAARGRAAGGRRGKELLELRLYTFASEAKLQAFEAFLAGAAIPALNRAGIRPVGAFRLRKEDNPNLSEEAAVLSLYVLLPHKSVESFITMIDRLAADDVFTAAGAAILEAPKSDPAYLRFESRVMLAFDECPRVEVPTRARSRLMQLRIYESHSTERALKKIEMFNDGGEIAIFRRCGLDPVFFGQSLAGSRLPNLTYMVSFRDEEAQKRAWDTFRRDPGWVALRKDEAYKDTVSRVTNLVLRPAAGSQI